MTNKMKELCKLMPPPENPNRNSGDWQAVEADLGFPLPDDYKEFTCVYGSGEISEIIMIVNPFDMESGDTFRKIAEGITRTYYKDLHKQLRVPFPFFPEEGSLLPFGSTENGDLFNWHIIGNPNKWKMVYWGFPGEEKDIHVFDAGFVDSFVELFSKREFPFWRILDPEFFTAIEFAPLRVV